MKRCRRKFEKKIIIIERRLLILKIIGTAGKKKERTVRGADRQQSVKRTFKLNKLTQIYSVRNTSLGRQRR